MQIRRAGTKIKCPNDLLLWMLARNVMGLIGFTALVYGLKYLPMGLFMIIVNTAPFWATLLGFLFLREGVKWHEAIGMAISFTAIVVLSQLKTESESEYTAFEDRVLGVFFTFLNVIGMTTVVVCTRKM
jgi:drug/metabolite transporter (DMT)-like permease